MSNWENLHISKKINSSYTILLNFAHKSPNIMSYKSPISYLALFQHLKSTTTESIVEIYAIEVRFAIVFGVIYTSVLRIFTSCTQCK